MSLFSPAEKADISDAVARAEKATAGELVVVHARRSDDYAAPRAALALLIALMMAHEVHLLVPDAHFAFVLVGLGLVAVVLYLALGWGPIVRLVVPRRLREARALERALRAFAEEGVTNTRDRSGVLIFLSELEHQVVILADLGINERVEASEWQEDVATILAGLSSGTPHSGVVSVVERIGAVLAGAFPPREDDTNELSDSLRER